LKKKVLTLLFVLGVIFTTHFGGVDQAKAAAGRTVSTVVLDFNETSASTQRVDVTGSLEYLVTNWGTKDVRYTIFKYGVAHASGYVLAGKSVHSSFAASSTEYSLRIYCGGTSGTTTTGCSAQGQINDY
jgi:hypothetical protein